MAASSGPLRRLEDRRHVRLVDETKENKSMAGINRWFENLFDPPETDMPFPDEDPDRCYGCLWEFDLEDVYFGG